MSLPRFVFAENTPFIPLNKGNWWLYNVSHAEAEYDNEKNTETIRKWSETQKIEILKVKKFKNVTVALFNNIPSSSSTDKATLLVVNNKDYYWANEAIFDLVEKNRGKININDYYLSQAGDTGEETDDVPDIYSYYLSFPLTQNKLFDCFGGDDRNDNYYCNWVRSIKPAKQQFFPGKNEYEIAQYTLSDESHSFYVDGVGMTYYSYSHHGTLIEERWNLQKYFIMTK
jgi:hypothetical protein